MSHLSSPREEFETVLQPLTSVPLERELPLGQRLWQQGWLRKSLILVLLAVLWEAVARYQNNDLLLPSFVQTTHALYDGLLSGELLGKVWISLVVLLKGYLIGIVLAFAPDDSGGVDAIGSRSAQHPDLDVQPVAGDRPAAAGVAVVRPGAEQPDLRAGAFGALGSGAQYLRQGFSASRKPCAWPGRNYGLKGLRFVLFILIPAALPSILAGLENRLGLCLAHVDRRRTGVWRDQRQGRVGLVHLPES